MTCACLGPHKAVWSALKGTYHAHLPVYIYFGALLVYFAWFTVKNLCFCSSHFQTSLQVSPIFSDWQAPGSYILADVGHLKRLHKQLSWAWISFLFLIQRKEITQIHLLEPRFDQKYKTCTTCGAYWITTLAAKATERTVVCVYVQTT